MNASRWRIHQAYGFGAARVALCGEAFHAGHPDDSLRRAMRVFAGDLRDQGLRRTITYSGAPALGLALIALLAIATFLVRGAEDESDIQMIPFAEAAPPLPIAQPEPPPVAVPKRLEEPKPLRVEPRVPAPPPPEIVAPLVKPAPPPPAARPARRPPPPVRRPAPQPPRAKIRVEPEIDRLVPAPPQPARPPVPIARTVAPRSETARPRIDVKPLASAPLVEPSETPPPTRSFRMARSQRPGPKAAVVDVDPIPARMTDLEVSSVPEAPRRSRVAPTQANDRARPRLDLAPAALSPSTPASARPAPAPTRTQRTAPASPERTRNVVSADLRAPQLRAPEPSRGGPSAAAKRVARAAPAAASATGRRRSDEEAKLSGVPLGSLAACRSDSDEDALKQAVVAAVTTQKECLSGAGHYRFLQVRNLNSFLLWVDRAPGRGEGDRCVELRHALECLGRRGRGESGSG